MVLNESNIKRWNNYSESSLASISKELIQILDCPCCLFFEGEMGVGKTTFIRSLSSLIENCHLNSPTYSILIESKSILHGDFYRLKSADEVMYLDLNSYCESKKFIFFEWGLQYFSEIVEELPEDLNYYCLKIDVDQNTRLNSSNKNSRNMTLTNLK